MIIPEARTIEVFGEGNPLARIAFVGKVELHHENYLRKLLTAHFRTYRVYSQPCMQVSGAVILFRSSKAPNFISPDEEEMQQILQGMNLMPRIPDQPARKTAKPCPNQTERAEVHIPA